jgi:spermidine synthase
VILYHTTNKLVSLRYVVALDGQTLASLTQYWLLLFATIAVAGGIALLFAGLVFPTVLSISSKRDPAGKSIGKLLAINGVGGLLGSELANGVLMSNFGVYAGFVLVAFGFGVAAMGVCLVRRWLLGGIVVVTVALALAIPAISSYKDLQYVSPRSKTKYSIEETVFGPEGVLLVVNDRKDSKSILLNNQYVLGSTGVAVIERRQLLLPWVLHPDAENVCCLGLATGISASGLEVLENPPSVTSIELSGNVAELAKKYFAQENLEFYNRRGNRVVVEDARTYIAATSNEYDLIVADLFRPHGAGEGRLFSVEHFKNVKRALKANGMFCQWLPAHQLNERQFKIIAATFQSVFPESLVVIGGTLTKTPSIGLCAWKSGNAWKTKKLMQNIQRVRDEEAVEDKLVLNPQLLICGVLNEGQYDSERLNTLDNAMLELEAGRFWVLKDLRRERPPDDLSNGFLSGSNLKPFLRRLFSESKPVLAPIHRIQLLKALR